MPITPAFEVALNTVREANQHWLGLIAAARMGLRGIKLIPLTTAGDRVGDSLYSLAARPTAPSAIQAAFLWYRAPHYYLFVSFDWCCRGVDSDYNIRVGRASSIHGPYLDRDGRPLLDADVEAAAQRVDRRLARAVAAMDQVGQDIDGHQLQARFS